MTRIKICGLRREEDIVCANDCMPDYVGFVFAESRRQVSEAQAEKLKNLLRPGIIPVGVFVNQKAEQAARLVNEGIIDLVQLHGDENKAYVLRLRSEMKRGQIMKAVRVRNEQDIQKALSLPVDYLLLDAFSGQEYGGTGTAFDWHMIREVSKPYFLAGGINLSNAGEAIRMLNPFALDVSSSVETDGVKDGRKMEQIVKLVRNINQNPE